MEFPRQEYWSGLPFPPPGDLPYPGIEPMSFASPALAGGVFTTCTTWKPTGSTQGRLRGWHGGRNSDVSLVGPELSVATLPASTPLITHFTLTCKTVSKK